jgi:G3E family GTPase
VETKIELICPRPPTAGKEGEKPPVAAALLLEQQVEFANIILPNKTDLVDFAKQLDSCLRT